MIKINHDLDRLIYFNLNIRNSLKEVLLFNAENNLLSNMLAWYPFAGNINDFSGNGRDLINDGWTPVYASGPGEQSAAVFNGIENAFLQFSDNVGDDSGNWTLSFFIKPSEDFTFTTVCVWNTPDVNQPFYVSQEENFFGVLTDDGFISYNTTINDQWYHFVYTKKSNGTAKLYIDGVLVATETLSYANSHIEGFRIMAEGTTQPFAGSISNYIIYQRELTASEITELYNRDGNPTNSNINLIADIVAWYKFDNNLDDSSNNGFDLSTFGSGSWEGTYVAGPGDESAASFVSTGAKLGYTATVMGDNSGNWTVSFFVKPDDAYSDTRPAYLLAPSANVYFFADTNLNMFKVLTDDGVLQCNTTIEEEWYHFAYTKDGTSGKLYINGVEVNSTTLAYTDENLEGVAIGAGSSATNFVGLISNYIIYQRALTADEVNSLYLRNGNPQNSES